MKDCTCNSTCCKGAAAAVSEHAGFLLPRTHTHTQKKKHFNPHDANSGTTEPSNLNTCRHKRSEAHITSRALWRHSTCPLQSHSITCVSLCAAVVPSLTKRDLLNPSYQSKENQLRVSHKYKIQHTGILALIDRGNVPCWQLTGASGGAWCFS